MSNGQYDILIVGGGLVGASLAKAISHLPLRIGLVEAKNIHKSSDFASLDPRTIALSYGSSRIFSGIGVWQNLMPHCSPILSVHITDQGHFSSTLLNAADEKIPALGYVISMQTLSYVLLNSVTNCHAIELISPAKVNEISEYDQNGWKITLEQNGEIKHLTTQLLIAADGTNSFIRSQQGIEMTEKDYGQHAILTSITHKEPHRQMAYERFTSNGSIAFLPLTEHHCGLIWVMPSQQAEHLMAQPPEEFLMQLQRAFGYRLGKLQSVSKRHIYPLKMTRSLQQTKSGLILLGNAAHTLHPIAAQGFNLTLRDVALLAELLSDAYRAGKSIADASVLAAYEQGTKTDQSHTIAFTQLLIRLFGNNKLPHQSLRHVGLLLLDILPSPKKHFTRKRMGISGKQPRLGRGLALHSE